MSWLLAAAAIAIAAELVRRARHARRLVLHAAHEVRQPLTAALLALEELRLGPERSLPLEAQLRRAHVALDDLTAAPAGRHAPDRLEPLAAGALVAHLALAWRPVAAARGIELQVTGAAESALVLADRDRLAQAAGNLLANALEHGAGPVELRARATGRRLRLEVRDGGPGLPAPVAQLSRRPRGARGHGLAVAGAIAARHGGRLIAAPSPRGAALALELPCYAPAGEASL
jgi:signal transduction histidine kinase